MIFVAICERSYITKLLDYSGLKLEDLPREEPNPPTTVGSDLSSTLSESNVSKLLCHSFLYSGIADLASAIMFLKNLVDWQSLGLKLGLLYPKL